MQENIPLSSLTTFHIGGSATFLITATTEDELTEALDFARARQLPLLILGGGSNILASDEGFDGLVIRIQSRGLKREGTVLVAEAGESWDTLVARSVDEALWGLENLSGIPGMVGGAIVGGIGAYGAAVGEHVAWVEAYDADARVVRRFTNTECDFGYRESIFSRSRNLIVLRAAFELSTQPQSKLEYKDLTERFAGTEPTQSDIRTAVLAIRARKFPDLSLEGTAGSFFKNPIVDEAAGDVLRRRYPELPLFPMPETSGYKVPLAWIMDKVLGLKGVSVGDARLFEKQPLVIAAKNGCTANDVRALANLVQQKVFDALQLRVEAEVKIL